MISTHKTNVKYSNLSFLKEACDFAVERQLYDRELWKKVVNEFTYRSDGNNNGWRGEYWGKLMRGACVIQKLTNDNELYSVIRDTVSDLIKRRDDRGNISSYSPDKQYNAWDLWCRKYVLLGLIYFLDICKEKDLYNSALFAAMREADIIMEDIGSEEGKTEIYHATDHWAGLNSSSILEPFCLLYEISGRKEYLDFAEYIVKSGMASTFDLPETAFKDELYPYQYPVRKAYEMMSCMEGVMEYGRIKGDTRYLEAVRRFADKIIESDVTVIGSCGCTHELFDNSSQRQTFTGYDGIMQETCVTVTWMKLCLRMFILTGEVRYADEAERSYYNAYLGALNTNNNINKGGLPYDSYAPSLYSERGRVVGGRQELGDGGIYGCCVAIAALGAGQFAYGAVYERDEVLYLNFFDTLTADIKSSEGNITLSVKADYPRSGKIEAVITSDTSMMKHIKVRIPYWCENARIEYEGRKYSQNKGYFDITAKLEKGRPIRIGIDLPMELYGIDSPGYPGDDDSLNFYSLSKGPVVFAVSSDVTGNEIGGSVPLDLPFSEGGKVEYSPIDLKGVREALKVKDVNGNEYVLTDYASAARDWDNEAKAAAWIRKSK